MSVLSLLVSITCWLSRAQNGVPPMPADVLPVTITPSGLKYCVLKAGPPGECPKPGDLMVV
ncbi:MAG: hypothetical protein EXS13_14895 [Planctomycetes bacterium]|nr:hypothetical protein [Planctomycetota bacterium]